jgi:thymidylate synthase
MHQYKRLLKDIMDTGEDTKDRTGIGSRFIFGEQLKFNLAHAFPATTIRPVPLRWAFEETMFFLRGETQTKKLEEKGITIWKGNTSREFLDKQKLYSLPEGDMGVGYGHQWRDFGGAHKLERQSRKSVLPWIEPLTGFDQIKALVNRMILDPDSRRHIVSAWNPAQLSQMALPPCHIIQQYNIQDGRLDSLFWMRSNDVVYGLPFNIVQYAFLNHIFARLLNLRVGYLTYQCGNSHIYTNQFPMVHELVLRTPNQHGPQIEIVPELETLDDVLALEWDDIKVHNYHPQPDLRNKPSMAV